MWLYKDLAPEGNILCRVPACSIHLLWKISRDGNAQILVLYHRYGSGQHTGRNTTCRSLSRLSTILRQSISRFKSCDLLPNNAVETPSAEGQQQFETTLYHQGNQGRAINVGLANDTQISPPPPKKNNSYITCIMKIFSIFLFALLFNEMSK